MIGNLSLSGINLGRFADLDLACVTLSGFKYYGG